MRNDTRGLLTSVSCIRRHASALLQTRPNEDAKEACKDAKEACKDKCSKAQHVWVVRHLTQLHANFLRGM